MYPSLLKKHFLRSEYKTLALAERAAARADTMDDLSIPCVATLASVASSGLLAPTLTRIRVVGPGHGLVLMWYALLYLGSCLFSFARAL